MTRHEELRGIEAEVASLIRRVKRVVGNRARLVHPELSPITYFMLVHVMSAGPLRAADLAEAFGMDKGGVSRQVQHLDDIGLLERRPDPDDRRAQLLAATPDAVRRIEALNRVRSARFDERLGDWSDEDLATFGAMLRRYNTALADD